MCDELSGGGPTRRSPSPGWSGGGIAARSHGANALARAVRGLTEIVLIGSRGSEATLIAIV